MFVSVIIPNYNHVAFLKQRIDSVLNQTYWNFEVILLDDASTDGSADVLNSYRGHEKVSHVVINDQNSGNTFVQWQRGLALAQGDYVWIAESDDYCSVELLEELVSMVILQEDIAIAFCNSIIFKGNEVLGTGQSGQLKEFVDGKEFIKTRMVFGNTIFNASMAIFKRKLLPKVDFQQIQSFKFCGDWLFWIQLASFGKVASSAKVLNYFRKHDSDITGKIYVNGMYHEEFLRMVSTLISWGIVGTLQSRYLYYKEWVRVDDLIQDTHIKGKIKKQLITLMFQRDIHGGQIPILEQTVFLLKLIFRSIKKKSF